MKGLSFQVQGVIDEVSPQRLDIACFIGCVNLRENAPRDDINDWLYRRSWLDATDGSKATYHRESALDLLDVPVPIESWESFNRLFAWERRRYSDGLQGSGYLAAAVREFFIQGGRFCYVIRVADNLDYDAGTATRTGLLAKLMPGYPSAVNSNANDRNSWQGVGHLLGLPDVSVVCMPDLPELFATTIGDIDVSPPQVDQPPEQFVVCQPGDQMDTADSPLRQIPAPVCDDSGMTAWGRAINLLAKFIAQNKRETQLIVALPLPDESCGAGRNPLGFMHDQGWFSGSLDSSPDCIASAFVQLAYPWSQSSSSSMLAQTLTPPDGLLAGLLARNALQRGTFRNISGLSLRGVNGLHPLLSRQQQFASYSRADADDSPNAALIDRLSLIGFDARGISVRSDVTTSNYSVHRPAAICRIIAMLLRAAREAGEEYVFENNGQALWAEITQRFNNLLRSLFDLGALRGKRPSDAYFVRCDNSTMTRQDIDQGRVIVVVQFDPAASIETIQIMLKMQPDGGVDLSGLGIEQAAA